MKKIRTLNDVIKVLKYGDTVLFGGDKTRYVFLEAMPFPILQGARFVGPSPLGFGVNLFIVPVTEVVHRVYKGSQRQTISESED